MDISKIPKFVIWVGVAAFYIGCAICNIYILCNIIFTSIFGIFLHIVVNMQMEHPLL